MKIVVNLRCRIQTTFKPQLEVSEPNFYPADPTTYCRVLSGILELFANNEINESCIFCLLAIQP